MPERNETGQKQLEEIMQKLEQGVRDVFTSENYAKYLQTMSKFHQYSLNNIILINMQRPNATLIAGYQAWKKLHGRQVMHGEKGIKILAPSPYKVKQKVEKVDSQGKVLFGKDGKPIVEVKEITIPRYRTVSVFDVSQTEGREIPTIGVRELAGEVEQYEKFFAALEKTSPVPIAFENIDGRAHGYYHLEEKKIAVQKDMSELQTLKTIIHEIAHAKLHDIDLKAPKNIQKQLDSRTREVEAESVAYTVCQYYGLDTSDYSFGYVAGWSSGREMSELRGSLETIREASVEIINSVNGYLVELTKQQEVEKAKKEEKAEKAMTPDNLSGEPTVKIIWSESDRLHMGETLPLSRANVLFAEIDIANLDRPRYFKTKFQIDYVMNGQPDRYEGQQDFGDGDGSLVEHIEQFHTHYLNDEGWNDYLLRHGGKEVLEADKEQRVMVLNEFVPYLKLHANLSKMEQAAIKALEENSGMTSVETAYHIAMKEYVFKCRIMVNKGDYNLPSIPQLKDFDTELAAYKEYIKEEIAQEAATVGMTVEEYAANDYELFNRETVQKKDQKPSILNNLRQKQLQIGVTSEKPERDRGAVERGREL